MKLIELTQGYFAKVDDEDYGELSKYDWYVLVEGNENKPDIKVRRNVKLGKGKYRTITMSRQIMNPPVGMVVDHINHDTLDNRKSNLRICSVCENQWNSEVRQDNKSGYKGVYKPKSYKKWIARIKRKGNNFYLGSFETKEEAAIAYNKAASELYGEFALLNSINDTDQAISAITNTK